MANRVHAAFVNVKAESSSLPQRAISSAATKVMDVS